MSGPPRPGEGKDAKLAMKVARKLMNYWRARGYPEVVAELVEEPAGDHGAAWGVRSNLINGLPPSALKRGRL